MKAVVTGASGLLGRQVVKAFENANCEGYKKNKDIDYWNSLC
jgi:uncharacterized protein YbjT (DUF2867 family)